MSRKKSKKRQHTNNANNEHIKDKALVRFDTACKVVHKRLCSSLRRGASLPLRLLPKSYYLLVLLVVVLTSRWALVKVERRQRASKGKDSRKERVIGENYLGCEFLNMNIALFLS